MRKSRLIAALLPVAVLGFVPSPAPAQVAPPAECNGTVGYDCARAVILKYLEDPACIVDVGPDHPVCVEPTSGPGVKVPRVPSANVAPPLPPECWEKTDYACARAYVLAMIGAPCLVDVGPDHPVCVEPHEVGPEKPSLPSAARACLNPVTCVAPFDNMGVPRVPAPVAVTGGATGGYYRPPPLNCDRRDYVTHLRSNYVLSNQIPAVVNDAPATAIARYLARPTLPAGLSPTDWVLHAATAKTNQVYFVTRSPLQSSRILGVAGLQRVNTSWRVYFLKACGEYLFPGSLVVDEHAGEIIDGR